MQTVLRWRGFIGSVKDAARARPCLCEANSPADARLQQRCAANSCTRTQSFAWRASVATSTGRTPNTGSGSACWRLFAADMASAAAAATAHGPRGHVRGRLRGAREQRHRPRRRQRTPDRPAHANGPPPALLHQQRAGRNKCARWIGQRVLMGSTERNAQDRSESFASASLHQQRATSACRHSSTRTFELSCRAMDFGEREPTDSELAANTHARNPRRSFAGADMHKERAVVSSLRDGQNTRVNQ